MEKILVIGAAGQIGTDLTLMLRDKYGNDNIIASDIKTSSSEELKAGLFEVLDVMDIKALAIIIKSHRITQIYHLAAMLSATAERKPDLGWKLNMQGLLNILEAARENNIKKVFWPSSIAVFGPATQKNNTPQTTAMDPNTVYGITKLAGERWCEYYYNKYGMDVRSIRYPGLISYTTLPGGGTTDYAVEIFHDAITTGSYACYLKEDATLPMMYMKDAIRGTIDLMETSSSKITIRSSYNFAGFSFAPHDLALAIQKHIPNFSITYRPDFRQEVAESWPASIDDTQAREDWGWKPEFDLPSMVEDMLQHIQEYSTAKATK